MAEHRRSTQDRPVALNINVLNDRELEMSDLFTPDNDDDYYTPLTTATTQPIQTLYSKNEYQSHTLKAHNKARATLLPTFPPRSSLVSMLNKQLVTEEIDFLLCNVPKQLLTLEQYQHRQMNAYVHAFELRRWDEIKKKNYHSYMVTFYDNIYIKLSRQWHIDLPIIDYNLARLHQFEIKYGFIFSSNDLPVALEFFLQMDIDLFHLKTCSFRQGQPRIIMNKNGQQSFEGIFTMDQQSIEGRYGLTPCNKSNCFCCKNKTSYIQFIPKQIHCFINQYKAILNCPVTCTTTNIIYALTCVCGEKDYVAHTNLSFADCLSNHRREIVRMIYEFLIGDTTVDLIELKPKSEETKMNDQKWLYQHIARCPIALKLFLDRNPVYRCFVPVPKDHTLRIPIYAQPVSLSLISSTATAAAQITTTTNLPMVRRGDTLAMNLANNVPKPTSDYAFTLAQFNEQKLYFKYGKDRDPINAYNLHFCHATIVAVLPDHCSNIVKKFIESLFITHAECQLNQDGRLIDINVFHDYTSRGQWYRTLSCRPSTTAAVAATAATSIVS